MKLNLMILLALFTFSVVFSQQQEGSKLDSVLINQKKMMEKQDEILESVKKHEGFLGREITNNMMMPTGYTLNSGEFTIGFGSIGYGINDKIQIGTNVLLFLFQYYNANAKVNLLNEEGMAVAAGLDFGKFNLDVFGSDAGFTSYSPFVSLSKDVSPKLRVHLSGQYTLVSGDEKIDDAEPNSSSSGSSVSFGLEHSVSNKTKLLAEGGYDFTFNGARFGGAVLWGWEKFRLKMGVAYYNPENSKRNS